MSATFTPPPLPRAEFLALTNDHTWLSVGEKTFNKCKPTMRMAMLTETQVEQYAKDYLAAYLAAQKPVAWPFIDGAWGDYEPCVAPPEGDARSMVVTDKVRLAFRPLYTLEKP